MPPAGAKLPERAAAGLLAVLKHTRLALKHTGLDSFDLKREPKQEYRKGLMPDCILFACRRFSMIKLVDCSRRIQP